MMASEPTEEAIVNFISFTSTSREQAIRFLKVSENFASTSYCSAQLTAILL